MTARIDQPFRRVAVTAAAVMMATFAAPALPPAASAPGVLAASGTYSNPLPVVTEDGTAVESCADPSVERDPDTGDWYMVCTTDPLHGADRNPDGGFVFHLVPQFRSTDLVNWTYQGDAFSTRPPYAAPDAGLWAPELIRDADAPAAARWRLYYTVTWTTLPGGGSAIGVATGPTPLGPWTHAAAPVVEPHGADCCGPDSRRWVFDPEVLRTAGADYIYYGSYFGGISVRQLSEDGLTTSPTSQSNVAIANKFEGAEVEERDGAYWLFVSATDCCRGPLTGYSVFVGRATSPTGPFLDRWGRDLNDDETPTDPTDGRAGGTPFLSMSGNGWVGPGHNTVFTDLAGQTWTIYHAIDEADPYFTDATGFTKRPVMLDAVDWVAGWPVVRGGRYVSDTPQAAPAAQPGDTSNHRLRLAPADAAGALLFTDGFDGSVLSSSWSWVREPSSGVEVSGGLLRLDTQGADLHEDSDSASVVAIPKPGGNVLVEAKVRLTVPPEGCCFNYVQGGLVVYGDDDNYLKLVHVSIWNTRQTEWAKELAPVPAGYPRYGNTIVGPPGEWTWLRVAVRERDEGPDEYTAYTSLDGATWDRGGTWTHELSGPIRIGLVSMGGAGFVTEIDHVKVWRLTR